MASNANLSYSCLSGRIYWGRTNEKGVAVGEQRDVTSEFLQVMEMKFPINTYQLISVNGDNKFAIISVDLSKEVVVNGVTYQHGDKSHFVELERQRDELLAALEAVLAVASEGSGISGWHLNGDLAGWNELMLEVGAAIANTKGV